MNTLQEVKTDSLPRQLRKLRGFATSRDLAESLGVSEAFVTLCETGRRKPGRDLALKWERLTGTPVSYWSLPTTEAEGSAA